jgi:hypothetical protein
LSAYASPLEKIKPHNKEATSNPGFKLFCCHVLMSGQAHATSPFVS